MKTQELCSSGEFFKTTLPGDREFSFYAICFPTSEGLIVPPSYTEIVAPEYVLCSNMRNQNLYIPHLDVAPNGMNILSAALAYDLSKKYYESLKPIDQGPISVAVMSLAQRSLPEPVVPGTEFLVPKSEIVVPEYFKGLNLAETINNIVGGLSSGSILFSPGISLCVYPSHINPISRTHLMIPRKEYCEIIMTKYVALPRLKRNVTWIG